MARREFLLVGLLFGVSLGDKRPNLDQSYGAPQQSYGAPQQQVKYGGPIVYSGEKPPIIHFPSPPEDNTNEHRPSYQPRIDEQEPQVEHQKLNLENPQLNHEKKQRHHHEQSKKFRHQNQPQKQQQQQSQQQRRRTQEKKESNGFFGLQNLFVQDNTNEYQQKRNEVDPGQARQDATKSPATEFLGAGVEEEGRLQPKLQEIEAPNLGPKSRIRPITLSRSVTVSASTGVTNIDTISAPIPAQSRNDASDDRSAVVKAFVSVAGEENLTRRGTVEDISTD